MLGETRYVSELLAALVSGKQNRRVRQRVMELVAEGFVSRAIAKFDVELGWTKLQKGRMGAGEVL